MTLKSFASLGAVGLVFLAIGCSGRGLHSVRGKVVFAEDGSPLGGGWVYFENKDGGGSPDSPIASDGSFELRTAQPGDGAAPGTYRVMIKPPEQSVPEGQRRPLIIDPRFTSFETSGIELVVEAKKNFFEIKVKKP